MLSTEFMASLPWGALHVLRARCHSRKPGVDHRPGACSVSMSRPVSGLPSRCAEYWRAPKQRQRAIFSARHYIRLCVTRGPAGNGPVRQSGRCRGSFRQDKAMPAGVFVPRMPIPRPLSAGCSIPSRTYMAEARGTQAMHLVCGPCGCRIAVCLHRSEV